MKILFFAYFFPPIQAVGGFRAKRFAEGLAQRGHQLSVISVSKPDDPWVQIVEEKLDPRLTITRTFELPLSTLSRYAQALTVRLFRVLGKRLKFNYYRDLLIPDPQIGWWCLPTALSQSKDAEVVFATCSPFSAAVFATLTAKFSGKPLVLDFRDAWINNPAMEPTRFHRFIATRLERWSIRRARTLILNTDATLREYQERLPEFREKMLAIPNGYDALNFPGEEDALDPNELTIVHVGAFYAGRDPRELLQALSELKSVHFIQVGEPWSGTAQFRDKVKITETGVLPRQDALRWMRRASLLYLNWGTQKKQPNFIAAKTYDYLATGRPILAHLPEGENLRIVRAYAPHFVEATPGNKEKLKDAIERARVQFRNATPTVSEQFKADYSPENLAAKLEAVLSAAVSTR